MTNDSAQQSTLVNWFDHHLKVLGDSYISFFQERARLEENYVDALLKLLSRVKAVDSQLDRIETSSTRLAWREVLGELERETATRNAFIHAIKQDVLGPLSSFKETQERTRKRIKEDLKESYQQYHDMAEGTLPRLRRTYMRRCQDMEDHRAQERAIEMQKQLLANPVSPSSASGSSFAGGSGPAPQAVSPTPLPPSVAAPMQRARSPSASGGLSDLAQHGKKQFGQLISFLNERREGKDANGPIVKDASILPNNERGSGPMRGVKAKREAEEADKEYRKGVFRLETLRLRREKILLAGYTSLEEFVRESAEAVKQAVSRYGDSLEATATANASLARDLRNSLGIVNSGKDASLVRAGAATAVAKTLPKRVLYENYVVGECHDLIFGVSLVDYATSRGLPDGEAPGLVIKCIREVEERGLELEGIYRVSGRHATVQELMHKIERDESVFEFNSAVDDVYTICSLLKLYLRELPEPVFRYPLADRIQYSEKRDEHIANGFFMLKSRLRRLPPVHQATLRVLIDHLARVAGCSQQNKMDAKNLSVIFGPVIFGEDEIPRNGDVLSLSIAKDTLMEDLITFAPLVFSDQAAPSPARPRSPPLPSKPENEVPAAGPRGNPYGTEHSTFVLIPPREKEYSSAPSTATTASVHIAGSVRNVGSNNDITARSAYPASIAADATDDVPRRVASESNLREVPPVATRSADASPKSFKSSLTASPTKGYSTSIRSHRTSPLSVATSLPSHIPTSEQESASTANTPVTAESFESTRTSFSLETSGEATAADSEITAGSDV